MYEDTCPRTGKPPKKGADHTVENWSPKLLGLPIANSNGQIKRSDQPFPASVVHSPKACLRLRIGIVGCDHLKKANCPYKSPHLSKSEHPQGNCAVKPQVYRFLQK